MMVVIMATRMGTAMLSSRNFRLAAARSSRNTRPEAVSSMQNVSGGQPVTVM